MNVHTTSLNEKGINYKEGGALLSWIQTEKWCCPAPSLPLSSSCASNSLFPGQNFDILVLLIKGHFCSVGFTGWNGQWVCSRPCWASQLCCMERVIAAAWSHVACRGHPSMHLVFLISGFGQWRGGGMQSTVGWPYCFAIADFTQE